MKVKEGSGLDYRSAGKFAGAALEKETTPLLADMRALVVTHTFPFKYGRASASVPGGKHL
ncbi:hypothetical protein MPLDJ20_220088 [Mesorhizobium plurifarium]|uniref:Uncharacterized protein n=1 Tax=Mesorhizobium plurifarium TaxID=69974 RepID=A0A090F372_MESPL|nr:hypothetical protein MPLSOD_200006 [Mesorhizobium sp. SOD10]CDX38198.1 hypothetical protein MPLDJ20_220088 [Mesorhizobium plurifarium]